MIQHPFAEQNTPAAYETGSCIHFASCTCMYWGVGVPGAQFCVTFAEMRNPELEFEGKTSLGDLRGFQKQIVGGRCREGRLTCLNGKDGQCHV